MNLTLSSSLILPSVAQRNFTRGDFSLRPRLYTVFAFRSSRSMVFLPQTQHSKSRAEMTTNKTRKNPTLQQRCRDDRREPFSDRFQLEAGLGQLEVYQGLDVVEALLVSVG